MRNLLAIGLVLVPFTLFAQFLDEQVYYQHESALDGACFADFDEDGDLDMIISSYLNLSREIVVCENNNGNYTLTPIDFAEGHVKAFIKGDFDGDGDLDFVTKERTSPDFLFWPYTYSWHLFANDGDLSFTKSTIYSRTSSFDELNDHPEASFADFDSNGTLDLLMDRVSDSDLKCKFSTDQGLFPGTNSTNFEIATTEIGHQYLAKVDVDNDGDLDLVGSTTNSEAPRFYENLWGEPEYDGTVFGPSTPLYNGELPLLHPVATDFDGDGDDDVVGFRAFGDGDQFYWSKNLGDGTFSAPYYIGFCSGIYPRLYTAQLTDDSFTDIVVVYNTDEIYAILNRGQDESYDVELVYQGASDIYSIDFPDLDSDGLNDITITDWGNGEIRWFKNDSGFGCSDPAACNYSDAATSTYSCCYGICGCADEDATNYSEDAECSTGCEFEITGIVFFDENGNGILDGNDNPIAGHEVILEQTGESFQTNENGTFAIPGLDYGQYQISVAGDFLLPVHSTPVTVDVPIFTYVDTPPVKFGLTNGVPYSQIEVNVVPATGTYPCGDWVDHHASFINTGIGVLDGIITISFSEEYAAYQEITPIDSIVDNTFYFSFESLAPGQYGSASIKLLTPTVEDLGAPVFTAATMEGYYEDELVASGEDFNDMEVICSYDPNDKQVSPVGIYDQNFVAPNETHEYFIRFQNTGTATAFNIVVHDTIDVNLDLERLEFLGASHDVDISVDYQNRLLSFDFENILLPDSNCCEPDSHGWLLFSIPQIDDLPHGTPIENTALIYFDNNPPIITNTTLNTVFICNEEMATFPLLGGVCASDDILFESTAEYFDQHDWLINNELASELSGFSWSFESQMNDVVVQHIISNAICETSYTDTLDVWPLPQLQVNTEAHACQGDTLVLQATGAEYYSWNGQLTDALEITPLWDWIYYVEGFNAHGCSDLDTVEVFVHQLDLTAPESVAGCPNEMIVVQAEGAEGYLWNDEVGSSSFEFIMGQLDELMLTGSTEYCSESIPIEIIMHPTPQIQVEGQLEVCQGDTVQLLALGKYQFLWNGANVTNTYEEIAAEDIDITLQATNEFGCMESQELEVMVHDLPVSDFSQQGNTLIATDGSYFQWFLDDVILEGATNQSLEITQSGWYSVEVFNEYMCSSIAEGQDIVYTTILDHHLPNGIVAFPNPASSLVNLHFEEKPKTIAILGSLGQVMDRYSIEVSSEMAIDISNWSPGVYHVIATYENKTSRTTFIVE